MTSSRIAVGPANGVAPGAWPVLPWREWQPTISTLHMWLQIVGQGSARIGPPLNHWWQVPLYVTPRGLTTSAIPYESRAFQIDVDFVEHRLVVTDGDHHAVLHGPGAKIGGAVLSRVHERAAKPWN